MELDIIRWVQILDGPFWRAFFEFFTFLGSEYFLIFAVAFIYLVWDKRFGEQIAFVTMLSVTLNGVLKDWFQFHRPIGQPGIKSPAAGSVLSDYSTGGYPYSYSFPSGHSQLSATFFTYFALVLKKKWLSIAAGAAILLVGVSRLFLGVHYPKDVLFGYALGVLLSAGMYHVSKNVKNITWLYLICFFAIAPFAIFVVHSADTMKALGGFAGFILGNFLEKRYLGFSTDVGVRAKSFRILIAMLGAIAVSVFFELCLPHSLLFQLLQYFMVVLTTVFFCPMFSEWLRKRKEL